MIGTKLIGCLALLYVTVSRSSCQTLDGRIVGGNPVNIKQFPYQLSLRLVGLHLCGASIISKDWALTAAHCIDKTLVPHFTLNAGTTFQQISGDEHQIIDFVVHEKYNNVTDDYDIAVLKVSPPFDLTKTTEQIIPLPEKGEQIKSGTMGVVSGWGVTETGKDSEHLMAVEVPKIDQNQCQTYFKEQITDRMLCFGYEKGGKDACQGDSGGPMVVNGKQVGVVSWGKGCAIRKLPGIYSNVATLRDWIKQNTGV